MNWIFKKDKKPEKDGLYLVFGKIHFTPDHVDDRDWYYGISICYYHKKFEWEMSDTDVIAWMPLPEIPEPYKSIVEEDKKRWNEED